MPTDVEFGRIQARDLLQHLWTGPISNAPVEIIQVGVLGPWPRVDWWGLAGRKMGGQQVGERQGELGDWRGGMEASKGRGRDASG